MFGRLRNLSIVFVLGMAIVFVMATTYPPPIAPLTLTGGDDVVQFTVRSASNQVATQLVEYYDAAGVLSAAITADGNFQASDGPGSNVMYAVLNELDTGIASAGSGFVGINIDGNEYYRAGGGISSFNPNSLDIDVTIRTDDGTQMLHINSTSGSDYITLGSSSDLGGLVGIDGGNDEQQLIVQGNATQTAAILVIETSAGSDLFTVDNEGDLFIGGRIGPLVTGVVVDGVTTFALTTSAITLDCTGVETIITITGGLNGMVLPIRHHDTECTIQDSNADTADTIDLVGGDLAGLDDLVLQLVFFNGHWLELNRSQN